MMSAPAEEAERLAAILREILALSETKQPNHSKSVAADNTGKLFDAQCIDGIHQTCAPSRKQTSEGRSEA